jgi:transposase
LKDLDSSAQKTIDTLTKRVSELESIVKKQSQYITQLESRIDQLLRHRFGTRSEKFINDLQYNLFGEPLPEEEPEPETREPANDSGTRKSRKKKGISYPADLEVKEKIVDIDNKLCPCGKELCVIGQEVSDKINCIPAKFFIDRTIYLKRACSCGDNIQTAKAEPRILPKIKIADELLAQIVIAKFVDRQPLYHLEHKFNSRYKVNIPRANMARWIIDLSEQFQPLINLMWDQFSEYDIGSLDATGLQVLKEDGRKPQTKSKVWCFIGGNDPVVLFEYNDKSHKVFLQNKLLDFVGTLHGDADTCYEGFNMSYCHAHNRRYYEQVHKATNKAGVATHILNEYQKLYKIEKEIRGLDHDTIKSIRQKRSKPILLDMKQYLDDRILLMVPKSRIAKAAAYTLNHWTGFMKYLEDGRLSIDNNHTERVIRKFVIPRNNFMFADTVKGAKALCIHFSIIQTAIANDLEPYQYYVDIMKALPYCKTVEDYERLLPWNIYQKYNNTVANAS